MLTLVTPGAIKAQKEKIATLTARLEKGWTQIETAKEAGKDTEAWQDHWINLLHEYEQAETELAEMTQTDDQF